MVENELWPQDEALFDTMTGNYQSDNERIFFETIKKKMEDENAPWDEVLISERDNTERIAFIRLCYDEFMLGNAGSRESWFKTKIHTMTLSEILNVNLKEAKICDKDMTFLQWLRENDYTCVCYDHRNDSNT